MSTYKYLFGPVPSRRLGVSLGVDLVPHKVCSLDCVYCECGATNKLTVKREEYVPYKEVITELDHYLENNPLPDYITFSGYGEPTLNSRIGDIITHIKSNFPSMSIAVLTNGTLFHDPEVRKELHDASLVLPSLDAATLSPFSSINRPHPSLDFEKHIQGLIDFRKEFSGTMWLEVFILPGFNDDSESLAKLKKAIEQIGADRIQLNTLDRPGTVHEIHPATPEFLEKLCQDWNLPGLEIIAAVAKRKEKKSYREDVAEAILETISRRPCTLEDLNGILNLHSNETNKYLSALEDEDKIETVVMDRGVFYQTKR